MSITLFGGIYLLEVFYILMIVSMVSFSYYIANNLGSLWSLPDNSHYIPDEYLERFYTIYGLSLYSLHLSQKLISKHWVDSILNLLKLFIRLYEISKSHFYLEGNLQHHLLFPIYDNQLLDLLSIFLFNFNLLESGFCSLKWLLW